MRLGCEEYGNAEEFLNRADLTRPGCAVVDLRLPGLDGLSLCHRLAKTASHIPVILVSEYWNAHAVIAATRSGVFSVFEKPVASDELMGFVRRAIQVSRALHANRQLTLEVDSRLRTLNTKERCVLDLILAGNATEPIQRQLRVSRRTVERVRDKIRQKMNSRSFIELAFTLGATGYIT
jgi:two-component system, LuxR family, response regulator FixJ